MLFCHREFVGFMHGTGIHYRVPHLSVNGDADRSAAVSYVFSVLTYFESHPQARAQKVHLQSFSGRPFMLQPPARRTAVSDGLSQKLVTRQLLTHEWRLRPDPFQSRVWGLQARRHHPVPVNEAGVCAERRFFVRVWSTTCHDVDCS